LGTSSAMAQAGQAFRAYAVRNFLPTNVKCPHRAKNLKKNIAK